MSDRLPSGSPRLDLVLGGGLPVDAINLIIGRPGTGKTILAQQYLFRNATKSGRLCTCLRSPSRWRRSSAMVSHFRFSTGRRSGRGSSMRTSARR